mgnify:CR=1 FL=1
MDDESLGNDESRINRGLLDLETDGDDYIDNVRIRYLIRVGKYGTCPVCSQMGTLVQDHCHATGLCRDIVCLGCNSYLGKIETSLVRLRKLLEYRARWRDVHDSYTNEERYENSYRQRMRSQSQIKKGKSVA